MAERRARGRQEVAVWELLTALGLRPVDVKRAPSPEARARGALGMVAMGLAVELDRPDCFGRAAMAKELRTIIDRLTGPSEDKPADDADHHHSTGSWDDPS